MAVSASSRVSIPPAYLSNDTEWKRKVGVWLLEVNQGHLNNIGTVTLTPSVATTTVTDARAGVNSFIGFMPTTANAAAELGGGTLYVATREQGSFIITHANTATADRTLVYCLLG